MSTTNYDPLVDVAFSYIPESSSQLTEDQVKEVKDLFQHFIDNPQTYQATKEQLLQYIPNVQSLEKLKTILEVDDEPIPLSPSFDEPGSNSRKKTRTWTNMEDIRLLKAIHKLGLENWNEVSQFVGNGRTRSQCSQRWIRVLDPRISKSNWTKEEEAKLVELVLLYGEKSWAKVSSKMGNRSDVQCRYRFQQIPKSQILQYQKEPSAESTSSSNDETSSKTLSKQAIAKAKSTISSLALPNRSTPQTIPQISFTQRIATPSSFLQNESSPDNSLTNSTNSLINDHEPTYNEPVPFADVQQDMLVIPEEIKFDERIPLAASSFDMFKSDQLFDSSFWIH